MPGKYMVTFFGIVPLGVISEIRDELSMKTL